ncbi:MAG: CopG family transcriptional regulator [Vicinamibacterales bacterium]
MKPIQVTIDDALLDRLDNDSEVIARGRSAVVREALAAYLTTRHARAIAEAYKRGYAGGPDTELAGWADEGTWPDE